jgi:hypothetical protein
LTLNLTLALFLPANFSTTVPVLSAIADGYSFLYSIWSWVLSLNRSSYSLVKADRIAFILLLFMGLDLANAAPPLVTDDAAVVDLDT